MNKRYGWHQLALQLQTRSGESDSGVKGRRCRFITVDSYYQLCRFPSDRQQEYAHLLSPYLHIWVMPKVSMESEAGHYSLSQSRAI